MVSKCLINLKHKQKLVSFRKEHSLIHYSLGWATGMVRVSQQQTGH